MPPTTFYGHQKQALNKFDLHPWKLTLTQPRDHEISLNFIFPIQYVIPKSLKVGHWLS